MSWLITATNIVQTIGPTLVENNLRGVLANATGYFLLSRLVHQQAVDSGQTASIIMLGSMYGQVSSYPDAYKGLVPASSVAYHTLKGGVLQLTRHLAAYWAEDSVRVNSLSPGPFPAESANPRHGGTP